MDDYQVDAMVENSYDSELEAEFFGAKDPEANDKVFGELEKAMADKEKEAEELKASEIAMREEKTEQKKASREIAILEESNKEGKKVSLDDFTESAQDLSKDLK